MKLVAGKFCIPCKMLKQWIAEKNLRIDTVIAEDNMELVNTFNIKSLPTLILDDDTLIKGQENIQNYLKEKFNV